MRGSKRRRLKLAATETTMDAASSRGVGMRAGTVTAKSAGRGRGPALGKALVLAALAAYGATAAALPIGFGTNQGSLDYSEIKSDHFIVYHDARTPTEAAMTLNALEAARPYLEAWMHQHRKTPLPVIMSAVTENASFADFITDAIELQTSGQGTKDLAWHEYTHSTMYRALDNVFGPAGNILHLPWMPAWFLEGLAEAMSVSVGSDVTAGIERYQALTGDWPSYDRLHSLYSKEGFFERGYSTSGAIVSYLLRKGDPNKLPEMLDDFYSRSLPWWWPWAMVPYNGFMPMDHALESFVGLSGEQLYEAYKKDAAAHWQAVSNAPFLAGEKAPRKAFSSLSGLKSDGGHIQHLTRIDGDLYEVVLTFDPKTGWATGWKKRAKIPDAFASIAGFSSDSWKARVQYETEHEGDVSTIVFQKTKGKGKRYVKRQGSVFGVWETPTHFAWIEQQQAVNRLCEMKKSGGPVSCSLSATVPYKLRVLGERESSPGSGISTEIWLAQSEEKLTGTEYKVSVYDTAKHQVVRDFHVSQARPVSLAFAGQDVWLLMAEKSERTVRRYDAKGQCLGMLPFKDHIIDLEGLADGSLVLGVYAGDNNYVIKLPKERRQEEPCTPEEGHTSPLQYALAKGGKMDLKTAMTGSSLWSEPAPTETEEAPARFAQRPSADKDVQPHTGSQTASSPAKWRPRPLFIFPWIGADDALGYQIGAVSVPLMDGMQNETVRATVLVGVNSRFPYQELALTSTRYRPTINVAVYREQTYNGRFFKRSTGEIIDGFLDEKGGRIETDTDFKMLGGLANLGAGVKYAYLKPYIGPYNIRQGWLAEPALSLGIVHTAGSFTFSNLVSGRTAPESLNKDFDYNQVGAASTTTVMLPFLESKASVGVEGSRTRGTKRRELQEVYRPLKTFVPGSGGGYNQNDFPLGSAETGLFAPLFGDTQARAKANWTFPLIRDVDKLWWILYLERLDFTAFYNYGAAWNGASPSVGWDKLLRAHGYNLDLQLENKGVRFNVGLGVGQVVTRPFEVYMTTGFDALF